MVTFIIFKEGYMIVFHVCMHVLQCLDLCSSIVMAANLPLVLLTGSIIIRIPFCVHQINVSIQGRSQKSGDGGGQKF